MEGMAANDSRQAFKKLADHAGMYPAAALLDPQESEAADFADRPERPDPVGQAWSLPKRQLWECVCTGPSAGGQSLLECLLRAPWQSGAYHALIDTASSLDPETLHDGLGERLLWVPVRGAEQAVRALDLLLRDDNFALVAADLRGLSAEADHRIQPFAWYRLQRLAHQRAGGALILSTSPRIRCADRRIFLDQSHSLADLDASRDTLLYQLEATTRSYARGQIPHPKTALAS
jgi:hypothetical protein